MATVRVDSREASAAKDIVESLRNAGIEVVVEPLPVGDYLLPGADGVKPVLAERKTVIDFINSIRDGRLWGQIRAMLEAERDGVKPVLLLEGWLGLVRKVTKWQDAAVARILEGVALDWGVPILPLPDKKATIAWLVTRAKSVERRRPRHVRLRAGRKPLTLKERILYVAEGFAGPATARALLERFGTLKAIANAGVQELMRVEGVGEKRAGEIWRVFNTDWRNAEET